LPYAKGKIDPWLLIITLLLAGCGIVMVYSASFVRAEAEQGNALYFLKNQMLWVLIGSAIMAALAGIRYVRLNSAAVVWALFAGTLTLLVAVFFPPFGTLIAKTHRWLSFAGVQFQPAELAKLTTVIVLAYLASKKQEQVRSLKDGVLPMMAGPVIFFLLINAQPDLGSGVVILTLGIVLLFVAGARKIYLGGAALGLLGALAVAIAAQPYRIQRVIAYFRPDADTQGQGYQIIQSLIAFGSGGFFGKGLGEGRQKLFYLPAPHTDFILATVGEELGLIGLWTLFALFIALLYRAYTIAFRAPDRFGMLLGFGLATLLALQIVINAMVVMGLLPNKGLALPFLSYGGSSAVLNFAVVGLLLAISRYMDAAGPAPDGAPMMTIGERAS
jgi:cell division protein FtsW